MELRHLRYFVSVAEERSFRRASVRLHISQPPLSRTIKQLEEQLAVQLFDRTTTGVELTAAGTVFLEEARHTLRIAGDSIEKARRAARGEFGHLEVAYYGSVVFDFIPRLVGHFLDSEPLVTVRLSSLTKDRQVRALRDGWLDVGFARYYRNESDLASEVVLRERVVLALPAAHALAKRAHVPFAALRNAPMIVFPGSGRPSFADEIFQFCNKAGFSPNVVHEAEDLMACLALVSGGVGVAPVPSSALNIHLPRVVFVPLTRPSPTSALYCVYRRNDLRPLLAGFLRRMRAIASTAPRPGSTAGMAVAGETA